MLLKGAIFDLDGTLVDSKLDFDKMRDEIGIPQGEPILEYLEDITDKNFLTHAHKIINEHEKRGVEQATLLPGVEELFEFLEENNIPKAVQTRNSLHVLHASIEKFQFNFDIKLSRDCCAPKPSPEGILSIQKAWGIPHDNLIYFGDFKFDIETAKNAGVHSGLILNEKNKSFANEATIHFNNFKQVIKYFQERECNQVIF